MKLVFMDLLDRWTTEKAWFLGAVFGDGNVHRGDSDYRVSLSGNVEMCEKWRSLICPTATIHRVSENAWEAYVHSKQLFTWFAEHGIEGEKATHLAWPDWLPEEWTRDFLRGLWDTDGSVRRYAHKKKNHGRPYLSSSFSGKNRDFVATVQAKLIGLSGLHPVVVARQTKRKRNSDEVSVWWSFSYRNGPGVLAAETVYRDAPEHLRNDAKCQVYRAYIEEVSHWQCACGKPAWTEEQCCACWWAEHNKDKAKICACGRLIVAKGLCLPCYKREKRSLDPGYGHKPNGICACGKPSYRKGVCDACYSRERRALPA